MEWSKLKNIILLILMAVNIFLLILVVYRHYQTSQLTTMAREELVEVLKKNGITMEEDLLHQEEPFWHLQVTWDELQAKRMAEAVLGGPITEEIQGGTKKYHGATGTASFQNNGSFSIDLDRSESAPTEEEQLQQIQALFQKMDLEMEDTWEKQEENHVITYAACQKVKGLTVLNCMIKVTYRNHCLSSIEGTCLMGEGKKSKTSEKTLSVFTALMELVQYEAEYGIQSKEIRSIEVGYWMPTMLTEVVQMEPVWCITTDQESYLINSQSGVVERYIRS